jgi:hypothetical protein
LRAISEAGSRILGRVTAASKELTILLNSLAMDPDEYREQEDCWVKFNFHEEE